MRDAKQTLKAVDGGGAELDDGGIVVRDPAGRPVLRYSAKEGVTLLAVDGDLRLAAPHGRVIVEAGEGLLFDAPEVRTVAGRWELIADRAVESLKDAYRTCEGIMQVRSGRMRHLVDGAFDVLACRASVASEEDTKIDGKRVLLG